MIKVGINGFGRIGRHVFKALFENYCKKIDVVAVNDIADTNICAHLLKHDSVYGLWDRDVKYDGENFLINGKKVFKTACKNPTEIGWDRYGVDIVIESTGRFRSGQDLKKHISGSVKKVIVTAPAKGEDLTLVPGVNLEWYEPDKHNIVSSASCTTNCVAQIINTVNKGFGINACSFITVHAYSNDQCIIDQPHSDLRRARALAFNIIPTTTGASVAVEKVLPELKGKIMASAYRVPVVCGSLVDCFFLLQKEVTAEKINKFIKKEADGPNGKYMSFTDEPLVSADFCADSHSCIVDGGLTEAKGNWLRVCGWYDNEYSYALRVCDVLNHIIKRI